LTPLQPFYGKATVALTLADREEEHTVPAVVAAIIACFDGKGVGLHGKLSEIGACLLGLLGETGACLKDC
jgi:hypothetical protein